MPEGPEVRIIAMQLNMLLGGKYLRGITYSKEGPYATSSKPEFSQFRNRLAALESKLDDPSKKIRIDWVHNKGKYIYMQLRLFTSSAGEGEKSEGVKFIGNHLGMTGNWRKTPSKHALITLQYSDQPFESSLQNLYFDDYRHFGEFRILGVAEMREKLAEIGPDVLDPSFTEEVFNTQLEKLAGSQRAIAVVLLDQSFVSGIGNYLRADILYVAEMDPLTPVAFIARDKDLSHKLFTAIKTITTKSMASHGTTIKTYHDIEMEQGHYDTLIYDKTEDPKGNPVETFKIQGRMMHWVPSVQT
jgi:formamidopyrimidine-DNA glycosylase